MSLRELAKSDNRAILEDTQGFGWPIFLISPTGKSKDMIGFSNDISLIVDPDTGQVISGREASIALHTESLTEAGFSSLPVGISDSNRKPWVVKFDDINGRPCEFKVAESNPDRTLGMIVCLLEFYR